MKILVAIPHYFNPRGGGFHGALGDKAAPRLHGLTSLILGLRQCLGRRQGLLDGAGQAIHRANAATAADLRLVVCTTGENHLLASLDPMAQHFEHRPTTAEPMFLGFECQSALSEAFGLFDYYCYMEDDLFLTDPFFFKKLAWFNGFAGDDAVLQPNRFELYPSLPLFKAYIDGNLARPEMSQPFQDVTDTPRLSATFLGEEISFQRVNNPHSGCFFLNAEQMRKLLAAGTFPDRRVEFAGPLESAATLCLLRHFRVYKPSKENAAFLEIQHLHPRYFGLVKRSTLPVMDQQTGTPSRQPSGWKIAEE